LEPLSLVVALVDITAGKSAESELEQHREHLEQLVEERTLELETGNDRLKRAVIARERAVEALEKSEGRFRFIAENSGDVIWTLDVVRRRFTYVSPSILALRGYTSEEVIAQPIEAALTTESLQRVEEALSTAAARLQAGDREQVTRVLQLDQPHRDGHIIHTEVVATLHADEYGRLTSVLGVSRNVTERLESERAIRELAFLDGLTRLPNRRLLQDRLLQSVLRARRDCSKLAILFIDLDRFKPVNDTFGHQMGDWLLCQVADRIQCCLRDSDTAARLGGDEFVVLLPDLVQPDHAMTVAERIRESLARPFVSAAGTTLDISASIGIALYPDHAADADELLRLGDEAMYQAKNMGRNRVSMLVLSERPFDSGQIPVGTPRSVLHLSWRPFYACGESMIDAEHRELFDLANRLFSVATVPGQQRDALTRRLERIVVAVRKHFQHEEDLLRDLNYPMLEQHKKAHRELLSKAAQLQRKAEENELSMGQLMEYLAIDVIARHLLEADREYFPLLRRRSSPPATGT
ncbi:MAG: bacteriohemerythrin, partial [Myxococcales bacterium]